MFTRVNWGHCTLPCGPTHAREPARLPTDQGCLEDGVGRVRPGAAVKRLVPSSRNCLRIPGGPTSWRPWSLAGREGSSGARRRRRASPAALPQAWSCALFCSLGPRPAWLPVQQRAAGRSGQLWPRALHPETSRGQRRASGLGSPRVQGILS